MHGFCSCSRSSCCPVILVQMMVIIVLVAISVVALRPALWMFVDCIMSAWMSLLRFVTSGTFLTSSVEIVIATLVSLGSEICLIVHPLVIALISIVERLIPPVWMEHRQSSLVSTLPGAVLRILRFLRFLAPASARELWIVVHVWDLVESLQSTLIIAKLILSLKILNEIAFTAALVVHLRVFRVLLSQILANDRVDWLSFHVVLQIILQNFLLEFVFEDDEGNLQAWSIWLLMNMRLLPLIVLMLFVMRSLRSMLSSFILHLPDELRYVLVDSYLIFKKSGSQNTKLDKVHVLLEFLQKSINDSKSKRMIFPNLYLLSPEN